MGPRQAIRELDDERCIVRFEQHDHIKAATRDFISSKFQQNDRLIAATLTLKRSVNGVPLNDIEAREAFRVSIRMINQRVFRNAFHRKGLRVNVCPTLEGIGSNNLHFHCIFETPEKWSVEDFMQLVDNIWTQRIDFGAEEIVLKSEINEGWIDYITKYVGIEGEVEWDQFHWE